MTGLTGQALRQALAGHDIDRVRDELYPDGWFDAALEGTAVPARHQLALLSCTTNIPLTVLVGEVPVHRYLPTALSAGLIPVNPDIRPAVDRAAALLDTLRLLLIWYPDDALKAEVAAAALRHLPAGNPTPDVGVWELAESCGAAIAQTVLPDGVDAVIVHDDLDPAWQAAVLLQAELAEDRAHAVLCEVLRHCAQQVSDLVTIVRAGTVLPACGIPGLDRLPEQGRPDTVSWVAALALDAYRAGKVPAERVATALARDDLDELHRELADQGWTP